MVKGEKAEITRTLRIDRNSISYKQEDSWLAFESPMPFVRRLSNRAVAFLVNQLCGQCFSDAQCGFRAMRRRVVESLIREAKSGKYEVEAEMLVIVVDKGFRVLELPIETVYYKKQGGYVPRDILRYMSLFLHYMSKKVCRRQELREKNHLPA